MKQYRVECTSYISRRVSNMAVQVMAKDAVTASTIGAAQCKELMSRDGASVEITKIVTNVTGA